MKRFIAMALSVVMLAAVLLGSFHHHSDEKDHPDCSICAVAHHQKSCVANAPTYNPPIRSVVITNFIPYAPLVQSSISTTRQSRAPPA
ncbi:MAG TPA: hypothetical protein HPP94_16945 [Desulfuromonadales bacterium]|nr:hypothetical protein [Desulfuromonadales bacterium]